MKGDTVVSTVMSNLGLENYLVGEGIKMLRTKVGDRFVTEKMLQNGYVLGGEPSGHIICLDCNTTGDGPITALHVISMMKKEDTSLSRLVAGIKLYPQVLINVAVEKKVDIKTFPEIAQAIKDAEESLEGRGRIIVRPSGTELKVRVMVEADEETIADRCAHQIAGVIQQMMSA